MTNSTQNKSSIRRLQTLARRRMALQLRLAGRLEEEIAQDIYKAEYKRAQDNGEDPDAVKAISQQAVSKLLDAARIELETETNITVAQYKAIQEMDIGAALLVVRQGLGSKDAGEKYAAIDRLNRLHERLARLEGLDAPAKTDLTSGGEKITWAQFIKADNDNPGANSE